jgi:hypothetical protein
MDNSAAVFSGEVLDVDSLSFLHWEINLITFAMEDCWKGQWRDTVIVWTENNTAWCGFPFNEGDVGRSYLVYAGSDQLVSGINLHVHLCSRTRRMPTSDTDELGPPGCTVAADRSAWGGIKTLYR